MLGIGIIGAGNFGESHAKALAALDNAQIVAACRTNRAGLDAFTARYGGRGYTDHRELLADRAVDAVLIATPHHLHAEHVEAAAAAGKHILLEKPMAATLAECERILAAARAARVKLMVGHVNHFAPAYQKAKEILDSGEMGEAVYGVSYAQKRWYEYERRWWHLDRAAGGGAWLTIGIHALERLTWLVNSPVIGVAAQFGTRFHDQAADDAGMIFVRYASGAAGAVVSTGYLTGVSNHLTELTCTKGLLNIDFRGGVQIGRDERWEAVPDTAYDDWMERALIAEWRAFVRAIHEDTTPPVSGEFAHHIMAAMFAAEESSRLKREIPVSGSPKNQRFFGVPH